MGTPRFEWQSAWTLLLRTPPPKALGEVDLSVIKAAFRQRVRETHPDRMGKKQADPVDGRAFRNVVEAYNRILQAWKESGSCTPIRQRNTDLIQVARPREGSQRVPQRRLALGQFLFHLGWISRQDVWEALRWQEMSRQPLGQLAVDRGVLRRTDVLQVLQSRKVEERFGACAVRIGILSRDEVLSLLARQRRIQAPLGQYFVGQGLLSNERLRDALENLRAHNERVMPSCRAA